MCRHALQCTTGAAASPTARRERQERSPLEKMPRQGFYSCADRPENLPNVGGCSRVSIGYRQVRQATLTSYPCRVVRLSARENRLVAGKRPGFARDRSCKSPESGSFVMVGLLPALDLKPSSPVRAFPQNNKSMLRLPAVAPTSWQCLKDPARAKHPTAAMPRRRSREPFGRLPEMPPPRRMPVRNEALCRALHSTTDELANAQQRTVAAREEVHRAAKQRSKIDVERDLVSLLGRASRGYALCQSELVLLRKAAARERRECRGKPAGEIHHCFFKEDFVKLLLRAKAAGRSKTPWNAYLDRKPL